jgi:hypothetical protein
MMRTSTRRRLALLLRALAWAVALGAAFGIANGSQFREARLLGAMLGAFSGIIDATLVTSDFLRGAGDGDVGITAQGLA